MAISSSIHFRPMSKIQVISTSTIRIVPPTGSSPVRINPTPWDLELLFLEYIQMGLLFPNPNPHQETSMLAKTSSTSLIDHLKASLERALHFFLPLSGCLHTAKSDDGAAISFFVQCNDNEGLGALFIHATVKDTNLTVADDVSEIVQSLFPLTGVRNHDGDSRPLLGVQVTELADGLFIGCSINHVLVDGTSFWHFIISWAEISRGEIISKLPVFNQDQLNLELLGSTSINLNLETLIKSDDNNVVVQRLEDKVFRFSKDSVGKLKSTANAEMESESKDKVIISSLQALIAHFWRSIIRCRLASNPGIQETAFEIPMGARQRLNPPLPEEYFGSAVFPGIVTLKAGELLEKGLGWTAWQINRMVSSGNDSYKVKQIYRNWIKVPTFLQFDGLPSNHFVLINSPRFDVYGNDFGWGRPTAARSGGAGRFDGRITIYGGLEEGSMEIEACLVPETLSALAVDKEFMEFVTHN